MISEHAHTVVAGKLKFGQKTNPSHLVNSQYFELVSFHSGHKSHLTWWKFLSQPPQIGQAIITLNTRHKIKQVLVSP